MNPKNRRCHFEPLEVRAMLSAAADITSLTRLRADSTYSQINGKNIGVAVIDTGTWAQHPDLRSNFKVYFDAVKSSADSPGKTRLADAVDPDGHGTHTAGTAVSTNPEIGVATGASLIAIRGLPADNEPEPNFDPVANALQWVLNNYRTFNIKVVNMSLGTPTVNDNTGTLRDQESALIQQLEGVGVTIVSAAGNNYADFAPRPGAETPGSYSTLVVSNTWADGGTPSEFPIIAGSSGNVSYFAQENDAAPDRFNATSQRSTLAGQIAAPGTDILSTWNSSSKLYQQESGTSMSAPFIAGTVALMQQAAFLFGGRYLTPAQIRSIITSSADVIVDSNVSTNSRVPVTFDSSGNPRRAGANQNLPETGLTFKRVNVYAAVSATKAFVQTGVAKPDTGNSTPPPASDTDNKLATATTTPALDGNATYNFSGSIGTDGQVSVGAADVDLYKVTLASPGVLSAQLTAGVNAFGAVLRLFDANGQLLTSQSGSAGAYPTLVSGRLAAGTYYLGISGVGNASYSPTDGTGAGAGAGTGDYGLTLGLTNPDPNGVPTGSTVADLLSPNDTDPYTGRFATRFFGTIGSDPNPLNPGGTRVQIGPTDVDIFRVVASDSGNLLINTLGAFSAAHSQDGVVTYIRVLDSNFREIARSSRDPRSDARLSVRVTFGRTYYVAISSAGNTDYAITNPFDRTNPSGDNGAYDFYASLDNGDTNGTLLTATSSRIGSRITDAIGNVPGRKATLLGTAKGGKDVNFYSFTATSSRLIDVSATPTSGGFTPVLALWQLSTDGASVNRVADTSGRSSQIIAPVTAGKTFYVSVTGQGNDDFKWFAPGSGSGGQIGTYAFTSRLRPSSDLAKLTNSSIRFGQPTRVVPGASVYANLGQTGAVTVGSSAVNLYRYDATYTGPLTVRATVPGDQSTDPFLRAFDAAGNELTFNDDLAASTRDAQVSLNVTRGQTYYLGVNPSSDSARAYDPLTGRSAAPGTQGDYVLLLSAPPRASLSASVGPISDFTPVPTVANFTLQLASPATTAVTATFTATNLYVGYSPLIPLTTATLMIMPGQSSATFALPISLAVPAGQVQLFTGTLTNVNGAIISPSATSTTLAIAAPGTPASPTGSDLAVTAIKPALPASVMPGDALSATVTVRSAGTTTARTRFSLRLLASLDRYPSPDDTLVGQVPATSVSLARGQSQSFGIAGKLPARITPGKYRLVAQLVRASGDSSITNNTAASGAFNVLYRFGNVPSRGVFTANLPGGLAVSLTGPGNGTVSFDPDSGLPSFSLSGTTSQSVLNLKTSGTAATDILNITSSGTVGSILGPSVNLIGDVSAAKAVTTVRLRNR